VFEKKKTSRIWNGLEKYLVLKFSLIHKELLL
jgi:hypothetical protein